MTAQEPVPSSLPSQRARTRALDETPALAERAVALLCAQRALVPLTPDDARRVVACMRHVSYPPGAVVFRAGDAHALSYMLLLLEGEVEVDAGDVTAPGAVAISVLGPGSVIGEMALLDGEPRSASCTALSPITAAGLSRRGIEVLIAEHPGVAARLLVGLATRIADRLRAVSDQLQIYAGMNEELKRRLAPARAAE